MLEYLEEANGTECGEYAWTRLEQLCYRYNYDDEVELIESFAHELSDTQTNQLKYTL